MVWGRIGWWGESTGVIWDGVVWSGAEWCGMVWYGMVWCGSEWCGVVWCGVVSRYCSVIREMVKIGCEMGKACRQVGRYMRLIHVF